MGEKAEEGSAEEEMREHIFRGKSVFSRKFVEGSLIQHGEYCCILPPEGVLHPMDEPYLSPEFGTFDGKATPVGPETVGESTGVHDKNGKRIFEGDIIKTKYGRLCKVVWRSTECVQAFDLIPLEDKNKAPTEWDLWFSDNLEIIGNIYDNPELTGGAK